MLGGFGMEFPLTVSARIYVAGDVEVWKRLPKFRGPGCRVVYNSLLLSRHRDANCVFR